MGISPDWSSSCLVFYVFYTMSSRRISTILYSFISPEKLPDVITNLRFVILSELFNHCEDIINAFTSEEPNP